MVPVIQDVACRAGVSQSPVDYALSGERSISRETRHLPAITESGFTPYAGARTLATSQTMVIGLFVQFFEDQCAPGLLLTVKSPDVPARWAVNEVTADARRPHERSRVPQADLARGRR
jgi:hypothetical protein